MTEDFGASLAARRTLEELGGGKQAWHVIEREFEEFIKVWEQNHNQIGRILRCHLSIEYFLNKSIIQETNINVERHRFNFYQKVEIAKTFLKNADDIIDGIMAVNKIRNQLAHKINYELDQNDRNSLTSNRMLMIMVTEKFRENKDINISDISTVEIIEQFSIYISSFLSGTYSELGKAMRKATMNQLTIMKTS